MKHSVTLISPMPPIRGGIARHSAALAREFFLMTDACYVEGFRRLYPKILYPGESVTDGKATEHDLPVSDRELDVLNPTTWRAAADRIVRRKGPVVMPAWTFFVAPCLGWIAKKLRRNDREVVMIVHNAGDHEATGWKNAILRWQLGMATRFVTHSTELRDRLRAMGLDQPISIVPHPPYSDFPPASGALPREAALELLCFGLVRPYKGIDIALEALALSGLDDVRLTIAGEVWDGAAELDRLAALPEVAGKVEFRSGYQSDQDAAELFQRADAVLLPYRSITGSGVLAMAHHYRRAVVASDLPTLAKQVEFDRLGWTFPVGNAVALAELMADGVDRATCASVSTNMQPPSVSGWRDMAAAILTTD